MIIMRCNHWPPCVALVVDLTGSAQKHLRNVDSVRHFLLYCVGQPGSASRGAAKGSVPDMLCRLDSSSNLGEEEPGQK